MTEEEKGYFMAEVKRIALELMSLKMDFPKMGPLSVITDDEGFFSAQFSDGEKIYSTSKIAGFEQDFEVTERRGKA